MFPPACIFIHTYIYIYIASALSILRVLQPYEKIVLLVYIIGTCKNDSTFCSQKDNKRVASRFIFDVIIRYSLRHIFTIR